MNCSNSKTVLSGNNTYHGNIFAQPFLYPCRGYTCFGQKFATHLTFHPIKDIYSESASTEVSS